VRAAAAKALREIVAKYGNGTSNIRERDAGEARWMEKVKQVKPGMSKEKAEESLSVAIKEHSNDPSGGSHTWYYRLDPHWVVTIEYRNRVVIEQPKLRRLEDVVCVPHPPSYSGTWTAWYVNGQKAHDMEYKDGKYEGFFTSYHDNGQKWLAMQYVNGLPNGSDIGWSRDGQKIHAAHWRNGVPDGEAIFWYPNGQKKSETNYRNGKKHGMEAEWDERGVLQSKREYKDGQLIK